MTAVDSELFLDLCAFDLHPSQWAPGRNKPSQWPLLVCLSVSGALVGTRGARETGDTHTWHTHNTDATHTWHTHNTHTTITWRTHNTHNWWTNNTHTWQTHKTDTTHIWRTHNTHTCRTDTTHSTPTWHRNNWYTHTWHTLSRQGHTHTHRGGGNGTRSGRLPRPPPEGQGRPACCPGEHSEQGLVHPSSGPNPHWFLVPVPILWSWAVDLQSKRFWVRFHVSKTLPVNLPEQNAP